MSQSLADPEPPSCSGTLMRSTDELEDIELNREWVGARQRETLRPRGTAGGRIAKSIFTHFFPSSMFVVVTEKLQLAKEPRENFI